MNKVFTEEVQTQRSWGRAGRLTTAQATFGTDKSKATIEALTATGIVKVPVPHGAAAMCFRFRHVTDGDVDALEMYAIRGNDHYQLIQIIETLGGKQLDGDLGVFVDTLAFTASKEVWPTSMKVSSQGTDSFATVSLNTHGVTAFLFIATTLGDAVQIDAVEI